MTAKTAESYTRIGPDGVQLEVGLEKGYMDMIEGRTRPVEDVFADIRRDYGL